MLNKLLRQIRAYDMIHPGERVIVACSGGADSVALLFGLYLLKEKLGVELAAAHFNHHLRGEESDRDEAFVRAFCHQFDIPLFVGHGDVVAGKKGLEAAAREARYAYFATLDGTIATAHTADDNAETVLLHLVRGTGLKGLGGITPKGEKLIRPMLTVTRDEVLAFLEEYHLSFVEDGSNETDAFLRNRLRHHVMPLLRQENPSLAQNLSATALGLRQDEAALDALAEPTTEVAALLRMHPALQSRALTKLLLAWGVPEPESGHVDLLRKLLMSDNPSASGNFPGNVRIARQYGRLVKLEEPENLPEVRLNNSGTTHIPQWGVAVTCTPAPGDGWQVHTEGKLVLRSRKVGDTIVLPGGRKSLKKLLIDRKVPATQRSRIPVIADDLGVVGVAGIGPSRDRLENPNVCIQVTTSAVAEE